MSTETSNTEQAPQSLWGLFRQAVAGDSTVDYTKGSIGRATFLLAVPMILEMTMESVFAIVDIILVAGLGAHAVATVGLTEAVITLLYAVVIGLSMGATALVARRIGEKDREAAARTAGQVLWLGLFVSCAVGIVGLLFPRQILALMGAEDAVVNMGAGYTRLMLGASFSIVFLFLINAVFRGAGDATIPMRALVLANGINIVLDPLLIYGIGPFPDMGVTGAAVATNIGRSIGVLYGLWHLFGPKGGLDTESRIRLHLRHLALHLSVAWTLTRVSFVGIIQFLVATASWFILMTIVARFGSDPVAGYTIAVRVVMFTLLPAWGLSNAAATLVGQNLGAGLPQRAETAAWQVARYSAAYTGLVGLLVVVSAGPVALFFSDDPAITEYTVAALRIFAYGYLFWGFGMAMIQAFNGAGDTMTPTWINLLCFWIIQVPLAYFLAIHPDGLNLPDFVLHTPLTYALALMPQMGPQGVFWAVFVADALVAIVAVTLFRRGRWKLEKV